MNHSIFSRKIGWSYVIAFGLTLLVISLPIVVDLFGKHASQFDTTAWNTLHGPDLPLKQIRESIFKHDLEALKQNVDALRAITPPQFNTLEGAHDRNGEFPLWWAVEADNLEAAEWIISVHHPNWIREVHSCIDWHPLHLAVDLNNLRMVKFLVEKGAEVDVCPNYLGGGNLKEEPTFKYYFTPIQLAACRGNEEIVKYLFEHGANPSISNNGPYGSAIDILRASGHKELAKELASKETRRELMVHKPRPVRPLPATNPSPIIEEPDSPNAPDVMIQIDHPQNIIIVTDTQGVPVDTPLKVRWRYRKFSSGQIARITLSPSLDLVLNGQLLPRSSSEEHIYDFPADKPPPGLFAVTPSFNGDRISVTTILKIEIYTSTTATAPDSQDVSVPLQ